MNKNGLSKNKSIKRSRMSIKKISRINNVLDMTPDGFCIIDNKFNILATNNAFCRISGYERDEILGMNLVRLTRKGSLNKLLEFKNKIEKKGPGIFEAFLKRRNEEIIDVEFSVNHTDPKKTDEIFVFIRDVSKKKKMERQILEQKAELEKKNIALKEILYHLEIEKEQIKKNITSNIENLILPSVNKLKIHSGKSVKEKISIIEKNLLNVTSSFSLNINKLGKLTPKETEICNMIKNGLSSKEIASLLKTSSRTIENHRRHIRQKLKISNQSINLSSYLQNF